MPSLTRIWVAGTQGLADTTRCAVIVLEAMKDGEKEEKPELTDLEKAALPTGRIPGGIVLREPGRGDGKRRFVCQAYWRIGLFGMFALSLTQKQNLADSTLITDSTAFANKPDLAWAYNMSYMPFVPAN